MTPTVHRSPTEWTLALTLRGGAPEQVGQRACPTAEAPLVLEDRRELAASVAAQVHQAAPEHLGWVAAQVPQAALEHLGWVAPVAKGELPVLQAPLAKGEPQVLRALLATAVRPEAGEPVGPAARLAWQVLGARQE